MGDDLSGLEFQFSGKSNDPLRCRQLDPTHEVVHARDRPDCIGRERRGLILAQVGRHLDRVELDPIGLILTLSHGIQQLPVEIKSDGIGRHRFRLGETMWS